MTRIYTRTGDQGKTGLADGTRAEKTSPRIKAIGDVDEANSAIGLARAHVTSEGLVDQCLFWVQNDLFNLGAQLAGVDGKISDLHVIELERDIDRFTAVLPDLKQFILPAGNEAAAHLFLARAIARRAERTLLEDVGPCEEARYLNRLSDLLFTLARVQLNGNEVPWQERQL